MKIEDGKFNESSPEDTMYALCYEQIQFLAGRTERIDIVLAEFQTKEEVVRAKASMTNPADYYIKPY